MRRSIGEGVSGRFVTSDRLLRLLKVRAPPGTPDDDHRGAELLPNSVLT